MKDFIYKKLIIAFIIFQPIFDIITFFMMKQGLSVTIGIVFKGIILALAGIYLVFIDKENRRNNIIYLLILAVCSAFNIYNSLDTIKVYAFSYFSYLFKFIYYLVLIIFFMRWFKKYEFKLHYIRIPLLIIVVTSVIALLTNSANVSYAFNRCKAGFSGWYSSANEYGNILSLFFPIAIYNAFHNKDGIKLDIYLMIFTGFCLLLIGTKVGLLTYFGAIILYFIIRLFFYKTFKFDYRMIILILMLICPLFVFNDIPAVYNMKRDMGIKEDLDDAMLSGRDEFLEQIALEYGKSDNLSHIFGKAYYGIMRDYEHIMLVEQDFLDVFIMYGYVGEILVIVLYLNIYYVFIRKFIYLWLKKDKISKKYLALMIAITLLLGISFIAGHTILNPAVSTYFTLVLVLSINLTFNEEKNYKNKVLLTNKDNYYKKLNKDKFDVYVLNENIEPYFIKIKCKLLKWKPLAYLLVRNQNYDYVLINEKDTEFDKLYLRNSNGIKLNIGEETKNFVN